MQLICKEDANKLLAALKTAAPRAAICIAHFAIDPPSEADPVVTAVPTIKGSHAVCFGWAGPGSKQRPCVLR